MASPKEEGFLTEEQREVMRVAAQNAEIVSPRSRSSLLAPEIKSKAVGGGKCSAVGGGGARHVRRSHSGKTLRAKKGGLWCFTRLEISLLNI